MGGKERQGCVGRHGLREGCFIMPFGGRLFNDKLLFEFHHGLASLVLPAVPKAPPLCSIPIMPAAVQLLLCADTAVCDDSSRLPCCVFFASSAYRIRVSWLSAS